MKQGNRWNAIPHQTAVMGILNITPDSFSDGGKYNSIDKAVEQAVQMEVDGAHIIDIGGESTRPNHDPVSIDEEIERVVPVIEAVKKHVHIPISIDTYKAKTAEAAVQAGASMINDIWGAKKDRAIAQVAARYDVPIILMHNRDDVVYDHLIEDVITDLGESIAIAEEAGVKAEHIIIDPGIGFGKTLPDNYVVLQHLDKIIKEVGYPLLLGTSRKSFITELLPIDAQDRD